MSQPSDYTSVFDRVYDVVVFGAGYVGLGALASLAQQGRRVLLIDRLGDVAWESGRAMCNTPGHSARPEWNRWLKHLTDHHAITQNRILPAAAETLASASLASQLNLSILYYVAPAAIQMVDDQLHAVVLATKSGLRRVVAKQFIDATEQGELISLLPHHLQLRKPKLLRTGLFFQQHDWLDDAHHTIHCTQLPQARIELQTSCWGRERCLNIDLPGDEKHLRSTWLPALQSLRQQLPDLMSTAVMTHSSIVPLPVYDPQEQPSSQTDLPDNVVCASPAGAMGAWDTLASRYELGAAVADNLASCGKATINANFLNEPLPDIEPVAQCHGDVAVAGLGTGGLMAAVAAGTIADNVIAFDTLPFAGGVGSGAGIHVYYHGVKGGLQDELDERIRQIMPLFGAPGQVQGYHPDARKIVADQMLHEAGVTVMQGMPAVVKTDDGKVQSTILCTPHGPVQINAPAWIDATGDGDLAAMAGATFEKGRPADGQLHAFTQSSGRASIQKGRMKMFCLNYDAGYVDPTDSQDLTRARLLGVGHYVQHAYRDDDHPTSIAPLIGIRQGRQIRTDYMITLADLINHSQFDDVIAYARCHYDNHAVDYELESDESIFWVWVCRQWQTSLNCDVPYRCLLPKGLSNLWLACRALGVSQDAHYALRQQRDMQRIGEVAGLAAAMASQTKCDSRHIDMTELASKLTTSGALRPRTTSHDTDAATSNHHENQASLKQLVESLATSSDVGSELWSLYQAGPQEVGQSIRKLIDTGSADTSWHAAAIAAMWGMPYAQQRLCKAITSREYGFENSDPQHRPEQCNVHMPRWVTAAAMLRICGNQDCLPTLQTLAEDVHLVANVRTSIALTLQRMTRRGVLSDSGHEEAIAILQKLLATYPPLSAAPPRRIVLDREIRHEPDQGYWQPKVKEDFIWQMHLSIAQALMLLDQPAHPDAWRLLDDERAIVRSAAKKLFENQQHDKHVQVAKCSTLQGAY